MVGGEEGNGAQRTKGKLGKEAKITIKPIAGLET
jgi:hypothetical protein